MRFKISKYLAPAFMIRFKQTMKEKGFKAAVKQAGWPTVIVTFLFFTIKGLLYLLIPYLIAKGVF